MNAHIVIKINMNNSDFDEDPTHMVALILEGLAIRIDGHPHFSPGHDQALLDSNGNEVGYCGVYEGTVKL